MKQSSIYSDFLLHYHKEFVNDLSKAYDINVECALALMNSEVFSIPDKRAIVSVLSPEVFEGSDVLADKIIDVLLASKDISIGKENLVNVLTAAANEDNKVRLVTRMISNFSFDNDEIASLLSILGGVYLEVAEGKKRPVLEKNDRNLILLSILKAKGFISSTTIEGAGIRVNPKRR